MLSAGYAAGPWRVGGAIQQDVYTGKTRATYSLPTSARVLNFSPSARLTVWSPPQKKHNMPTYTIDQYAANNNWAAIDALGSRLAPKASRCSVRSFATSARCVTSTTRSSVCGLRDLVEELVAAAAIVDERRDDAGGMQCLVKWLDSAEENTWVPETNCNEALGQFDEVRRVLCGPTTSTSTCATRTV